jgi:hypothetical protein
VYRHVFALLHPASGALLAMAYFLTLMNGARTAQDRLATARPHLDAYALLEILAVIRTQRYAEMYNLYFEKKSFRFRKHAITM